VVDCSNIVYTLRCKFTPQWEVPLYPNNWQREQIWAAILGRVRPRFGKLNILLQGAVNAEPPILDSFSKGCYSKDSRALQYFMHIMLESWNYPLQRLHCLCMSNNIEMKYGPMLLLHCLL